jgi:hypothetical protein
MSRIQRSKDTLNDDDYRKAIDYVTKVHDYKVDSILNFYYKLNSFESALQVIQLLKKRKYDVEKKIKAIDFINSKIFGNAPILSVGIYKGLSADNLPSSYQYFIRDVAPKEISIDVIKYLQGSTKKSKYISDFVYDFVYEKKNTTKIFTMDDFN